MLNKLSEQIRECVERAEDCARKAAAQPDGSALQQDFLSLQKHWLNLARSYQTSDRVSEFTDSKKQQSSAPIIPFLEGQAFEPEAIEAMGKALATTCETLGLNARDDAMTQLVAEKIIQLAQRGLKNPTALHSAAIKELKSDGH